MPQVGARRYRVASNERCRGGVGCVGYGVGAAADVAVSR